MSTEQDNDVAPSSPDIHFEPIVNLAKVDIKTLEEDEDELIKMRAKLFRYITGQHDESPEWKERGIGDVKILKHRTKLTFRLVMRREKTLKVCANHFLNIDMELKPNCGSDRAWVWNVSADYADEEPRPETLAIRFANAENAQKFKEVFDNCKEKLQSKSSDSESEKLANELESLKVDDTAKTDKTEQEDKPSKGQEVGETEEGEVKSGEENKEDCKGTETGERAAESPQETKENFDTSTDKPQESSQEETKGDGQ